MDEVATPLTERSTTNPSPGAANRQATAETAGGSESIALTERAGTTTAAAVPGQDRVSGSKRNTSRTINLADGDRPQTLGRIATARGLADQVTDDTSTAEWNRNTPAGMAIEIDAKVGPAGISNDRQEDPGIDSRRALRSSPALQSMTETRFRREQTGGAPSISAAPIIAKEAFRTRNQPSRSRSAPQTEAAIELGLAFLARQQQEDGSWTLHTVSQDQDSKVTRLASDTAATGLAILAFQGAGYNHREFKYAGQLQAAVEWLIENQRDTGELYLFTDPASDNVCRFYSHGIATLALAEAYGMTQDEDLRIAVQLALDYIAETQNTRLGGWRYRPGVESDTSVTGWMMMALQSGRLADLETDEATWRGIERWLSMARTPSQDHLFRYNPEALDRPETRHGREASPCMTAVGLLMHLYLGWDRQDPRLTQGAQYLLENLPDDTSITQRDTYYWYYATQIIRHVGGESWQQWHAALHPLLVGSQIKQGELAGSWDPLNPVPDRWGAQAGRLYVTAMNLLSLEVDYRLLPLHDDTVK